MMAPVVTSPNRPAVVVALAAAADLDVKTLGWIWWQTWANLHRTLSRSLQDYQGKEGAGNGWRCFPSPSSYSHQDMFENVVVHTLLSTKYVLTMYVYELAGCDFLTSTESPLHVDTKTWKKMCRSPHPFRCYRVLNISQKYIKNSDNWPKILFQTLPSQF